MQIILRDICKYYGAVKANNGISLIVEPGTIHGILGENGAGKSTLMKILSGYIRKTSGEIFINHSPVTYQTPARASELGIGMLYQEPLDFPQMSVLENFMTGRCGKNSKKNLGGKSFFNFLNLNWKTAFLPELEHHSQQLGFDLNPHAMVGSLTIGERQQLELLRLLAMGTRVLILDEPTTGISGLQKEILFNALRKLASEGKSVILVSHKLEDANALCDTITVLRQGVVAGQIQTPFDTDALLKMMFKTAPPVPSRIAASPGKNVLEMKNISASMSRSGLRHCSTMIREGEVVGLAGLEGSGQEVFLRVAAGIYTPFQGDIHLENKNMTGKDYHAFKAAGVSFLPSARLEEGLIRGLTLAEHAALQNKSDKSGRFWIRWQKAFSEADRQIESFNIKGTPEMLAESLSGGNQQRFLLSFLSGNPRLLLLENPTRGLDVESANWVWQHLRTYCENGAAIVFSASELDEILMVADRVMVFFNGEIIKDVRTRETDINELGSAIAGRTV